MRIFLAIVCGIVGSLVGFAPYLVVRSRMKAQLAENDAGGFVAGLAATLVSFVLMFVLILLCSYFFKPFLLPFALSVIAVFLVAMVVFTVTLKR